MLMTARNYCKKIRLHSLLPQIALAADRQLFSSPADITFVIVGNVAEDKLVALITRYLGSIKHSDSPLAAGKTINSRDGQRIGYCKRTK
ncbi:peptidase [Escherichia coli]|uniref:Peptidase n=1 Tax=Escherichia coli TaxID=562 RepID=A0A2X1MXS4_ECOLX|nr:peptidase [Escherichia coli]